MNNHKSGFLVFEENFEGESLNLSKWEYDLGNGINGWGNKELEYYRKSQDNIYIKNNQLHISAKVQKFGGQQYTSAKITTKNTFQFTYGYIEARIKLPIGNGIWPAFWMLGANIDDNIWPKCGEIDIVEAINTEKKIYNTLHWYDNNKGKHESNSKNSILENRDDFHIYGLKWTKDEITMYLDGNETFSINLNKINTNAFTKPFYLLLNVAVGGEWPGFNIDESVFPLEMVIDYIKIYQEVKNFKYLTKYLIWEDNFDDENLNKGKWAYVIGTGDNGWGTFQEQYYTDNKKNIYLSNSNLHIKAIKENYKEKKYTSGRIHTKGHLEFTYGIIETRIKFPSVNGLSPGFWLSGLFNDNIWPNCGEIDALIGKDGNNKIYSGCIWGESLSYYKNTQLDLTSFIDYTIIWNKNYITVYADDLELYKIDITPAQLKAFHNPFYLNLNLLVGGNTVDESIDDSAFPVEMLVDYIKIYQYDLKNNISDKSS